jgi:hypothetical protein
MKGTVMESRQQEMSNQLMMEEWADLSAWQGYEFWSSQLEVEMEWLAELQQAMNVAPVQAQKGRNNVLPF